MCNRQVLRGECIQPAQEVGGLEPVFVEQMMHCNDQARCAKPALHAAFFDKCLLHVGDLTSNHFSS
jgi:hypothetical protein